MTFRCLSMQWICAECVWIAAQSGGHLALERRRRSSAQRKDKIKRDLAGTRLCPLTRGSPLRRCDTPQGFKGPTPVDYLSMNTKKKPLTKTCSAAFLRLGNSHCRVQWTKWIHPQIIKQYVFLLEETLLWNIITQQDTVFRGGLHKGAWPRWLQGASAIGYNSVTQWLSHPTRFDQARDTGVWQ